ncbi:Alpha/Beta hydrolase protein [Lophiotrema nucula]|uniref:Alpha/Beta hydrolase protein n=1 Tax=Lophiotrema nucula TaxID=690887 RepID=A0A6A5YUR7_9PLEO|nr:Alpha/Beta hydrolase protein [Lophiotrema nucula]
MAPPSFYVFVLLNGFAAAKTCCNLTIPVSIASRQGLFASIPQEGNLDATAFSQAFTTLGGNYTEQLLEGYQTLTGDYEISAKFCYPDGGSKDTVIQLLSHGIGFDKTYWDLSFNNYNYSYVNAAVAAGYSTLAIDRFGIGNSSHGDPLNTIQAQAEVEALNAITTKLRNGDISEIGHAYDKVIHVGHSFGSVQSYWLSALYPDNTDGLVLTGWAQNGSFLPMTVSAWNLHQARLNQPLRLGSASNSGLLQAFSKYSSGIVQYVQGLLRGVGVQIASQDIWEDIATTEVGNLIDGWNTTVQTLNYPNGYLIWSDLTANQFTFLLRGRYDVSLGIVAETTKHPVTTGELLTIGSAPAQSPFTGPVLVFTGENDQPFCGGNCYATGGVADNIPAEAAKSFPGASAYEAYIQPATAHGLNVHYNATAGYNYIQSWLGSHGLAA